MNKTYKKVYYNNVIEYILKNYYDLKESEVNYETLELFFDDEKREREIINRLSNFRKNFNVVYQGFKNSYHWYKISIKEIEELQKLYNGWRWNLIEVK